MAVLTPQQRNTLESAVMQARKVAETGAFNALQSMAVDHPEPFPHMTAEQRALRNNLRSKARLLGDSLQSTGTQKVDHLSYELAYETWHKMLFAKFLEVNGLLMHPDGVAVTLQDCEELATEEGFIDKWDAAANYASKMLPAIFRPEDPLMQVEYASDERVKLESILDGLEDAIFNADDALGWVYQFWQSEEKIRIEEEERHGIKIDGGRLPAKTQLFTEPYMVQFLIDNTIGAWWLSRNPDIKPPVRFDYLRLLNNSTPAAGRFEGWPDKAREITVLDPSMGSGHFIASLFPILAALRMKEENLTKDQASDKVITENLHGLELDARCTQIAAFNLAMTVWKFCGHYRELPEMNLACSGLAPKGTEEDWVKLVGNVPQDEKSRMENGMRAMYKHFQLAPELGSLLEPAIIKADVFTASFHDLQAVLKEALKKEVSSEQKERGVVAAGIAAAGELLTKKYTLQITNVPYLARGKQGDVLLDFCEAQYPKAKGNLATVFLERMLKSAKPNGVVAHVTIQDWLFQKTYKDLRQLLLKNEKWLLIVRIGAKGFRTQMYDFNVMLLCIQHRKATKEDSIFGLDIARGANPTEKDILVREVEVTSSNQLDQLINPDARIAVGTGANSELLALHTESLVGLQTSDDSMFVTCFWEQKDINRAIWELLQDTPTHADAGMSYLVRWENGQGLLLSLPTAYPKKGLKALGKAGIAINRMGDIYPFPFGGERFHQNVAVLLPSNEEHLGAIWCFCSSPEFQGEIRKIDQALKVTNATLVKVPFDLHRWQSVASEKFPNGLLKPYSNDPTQWLFHGHPAKATHTLQVALARLLSYRWPAENDKKMELADEARRLIQDVKAFDYLADGDGIFCIPSVNGEAAGAERLRDFLQAIFQTEWNIQTINTLLQKEEATSSNLETWLRDEFFVQHCKVFQNRPFIWHVWDGRKDGFSVLVNYHKLTKDNLSKLVYTYLNDWIRLCESKKRDGESGAEGLLSAALKLKEKLEAILEGEAPYDIFVRWKTLEQQPIGWEPDPNDGVRLNIRPFITADVLRKKPNIKWGVDRGKNPSGSPWGQVRDNDRHLTLEEKKAAREKGKK